MQTAIATAPSPAWLDFEEYPFAAHYLPLPDGTRLHYADEGAGPETVLFVHGTPAWSFDFRHHIQGLRGTHRCVAPDPIGFGLSDKLAHYDYRPQQHAHNLAHLIDQRELRDLTLVVHDFGGPIGLAYALSHPERVRRVVVLNSWLWDASADPAFQRLRRVLNSPLLPLLYCWLNISARARVLLPQSFGAKPLARRLRGQYTTPLGRPAERNGPRGRARALVQEQPWFGQLWEQRAQLRAMPALLLWGLRDPWLGDVCLQRFASIFRQATVVPLSNCGHVPQEEEAAEVLTQLRAFLQAG